jgi:hypothetical protein
MTNHADFLQLYLEGLARHEYFMSTVVTIVVGVVGLIFAMGAFLVWHENRAVIRAAREQLNLVNSQRKEIDAWFTEKRASLDLILKAEFGKFKREIEEMRCYQTLVMALENTAAHAALIFPALCVLAERPCALYVGVFREIINRGITPDITDRANMGLQKWHEMQSKAVPQSPK